MEKPIWIVENFVKERSYSDLVASIKKHNYDVLEINGDFKKTILEPYKDFTNGIIFQGSIQMADLVKKELPLLPDFYNKKNYNCSSYYSHYGDWLFNDKYALCSLSELQRNKYFYYGIFGKEGVIFVRPDEGDKSFQAQLLDILDLDSFLIKNYDLRHKLVLVSTPKKINWEGRFVVSKSRKIIAHSTYQFQGLVTKIPTVPKEAYEFCNFLLLSCDYFPDEVFVMDICEDVDHKPWLLELNSFCSSSLYETNKDDIVKSVSEIYSENI